MRSALLPKYQVGELAAETGATTFEADLGEGQFYNVLKRRVESYFRDKKARDKRARRGAHPSLPLLSP